MVEEGIYKNFFGDVSYPTGNYIVTNASMDDVKLLEKELENISEEYNILYNSLNTVGEQLLKQIALNRALLKENEILLEQKEAIWQSIQKN